jgi:hypothetical protein
MEGLGTAALVRVNARGSGGWEMGVGDCSAQYRHPKAENLA